MNALFGSFAKDMFTKINKTNEFEKNKIFGQSNM